MESLSKGPSSKPTPVPSLESRPYWEGLKERRLLIPHCGTCGHWWFPPSALCPRCNADKPEWRAASGCGKVFSYVVFHRVYHPAYAGNVPYAVALIELEEGPRLVSNLVGVDLADIRCEMPVIVVFEELGEWVVPKFKPRKN